MPSNPSHQEVHGREDRRDHQKLEQRAPTRGAVWRCSGSIENDECCDGPYNDWSNEYDQCSQSIASQKGTHLSPMQCSTTKVIVDQNDVAGHCFPAVWMALVTSLTEL